MKKLLSVTVLAMLSGAIYAQDSRDINSAYTDTAVVSTKAVTVEERLRKQELEVQLLKKDSEVLKKQVSELKSALPGANRKFSVSRRGSKQVIAE